MSAKSSRFLVDCRFHFLQEALTGFEKTAHLDRRNVVYYFVVWDQDIERYNNKIGNQDDGLSAIQVLK